MKEIKQIEFSKLKHAYITVKSFIENESADDLESLKTKIVNGLGLTLNRIHISKPSFYQPARQVSDMTFRDLLTWYIEGKYIPEGNVKYAIKNR